VYLRHQTKSIHSKDLVTHDQAIDMDHTSAHTLSNVQAINKASSQFASLVVVALSKFSSSGSAAAMILTLFV
jgi:hypothetical protein